MSYLDVLLLYYNSDKCLSYIILVYILMVCIDIYVLNIYIINLIEGFNVIKFPISNN